MEELQVKIDKFLSYIENNMIRDQIEKILVGFMNSASIRPDAIELVDVVIDGMKIGYVFGKEEIKLKEKEDV